MVGGQRLCLYTGLQAGSLCGLFLLLLRGNLGRLLHGIGIKRDGIRSSVSGILATVTM